MRVEFGRRVPARISATGRWIKYAVIAPAIDGMLRHTSFLDGSGSRVPPGFINFAGGGGFTEIGRGQVRLIALRAGLCEDDRVLDVGCGIGRIAAALAERAPSLDYVGFDPVRFGITWCRKTYRDLENFAFLHADIRNGFYNPRGSVAPEAYRFPQGDGARTLVVAVSVFSHLREAAMRRYLAEAARVLEPRGRLYLTGFVIPDGGLARNAAFDFRWREGEAFIERPAEPELAVGYRLELWRSLARGAGLHLAEFHRGSWSGATDALDFQDALLFRRTGSGDRQAAGVT